MHAMNLEELKREVDGIDWWHTIDLGQGVVTPGKNNTPERLSRIHMPDDLSGKTVLDMGAWDGFYSFEAERRGADRVVAADYYVWSGQDWGSKSGFNLARKALDSKVEDVHVEVMDLSTDTVGGPFDLVLFLGVLYHVRYPLRVLENVAAVTKDHLILETVVDMVGTSRPVMAFYPDRELMGDPTNWWGPNPAAVIAMLKNVGFKRVEIVWRDPLPYRIARAVVNQFKLGTPIHHSLRQSRIVCHAWK